jgi:hypothetical protein
VFITKKPSEGWGAWGPDLAFIRVPQGRVPTIEAKRCAFYDLQKVWKSDGHEFGACMVVGTPDATKETDVSLWMMPFFASIPERTITDGWDYLDLDVWPISQKDLPTLRGVSGGGFWVLRIARLGSGPASVQPLLGGVVFYEHPTAHGVPARVRCHGLQSLRRCFNEKVQHL